MPSTSGPGLQAASLLNSVVTLFLEVGEAYCCCTNWGFEVQGSTRCSGVFPFSKGNALQSCVFIERVSKRGQAMGAAAAGVFAHIGKTVHLKGELSGSEDVYVDGQIEGSVHLGSNNLTIGPNGRVQANIVAKNVAISGTLEGNIRASGRTELRKTAIVNGDVWTRRIAVEEGAYLQGKLEIIPAEAAPSQPVSVSDGVSSSPRFPEPGE
jgi:cytoskeletal protein CcmA (bactofilin family)